MKYVKKNLFGIGIACSILLGVGLSFVPKTARANATEVEPGARCYIKIKDDSGVTSYACGGNPCTWVQGNGTRKGGCN